MNKKPIIALAFFALAGTPWLAARDVQPVSAMAEIETNWTLIAKQNGINAMATEIYHDNKIYLYLKFENTSNSTQSFGWELKDKNGKVVTSTSHISLAAGASLSGFDDATLNGGNMNLVLPASQSMADFTIHINQK